MTHKTQHSCISLHEVGHDLVAQEKRERRVVEQTMINQHPSNVPVTARECNLQRIFLAVLCIWIFCDESHHTKKGHTASLTFVLTLCFSNTCTIFSHPFDAASISAGV